MTKSNLDSALAYANGGWAILPIRENDKAPPLTTHGFKDASTDSQQIRAWWTECPDANIAVATGPISGLVVFDVDVRPGKDGTEAARELGLASSRCASTPTDGFHHYFRHPGIAIKSRNNLRPGLDVKADGGYVLLPPSRIGDQRYRWLLEGDVPQLPPRLLEILTPPRAVLMTGAACEGELIHEGSRNDTLFRIGCCARAEGKEYQEILEHLRTVNANRCKPTPLPLAEIERIANSCARYPMGQRVSFARTDKDYIDNLVRLTPLEYDRARIAAATDLGVTVGALDSAVRQEKAALAIKADQDALFTPVTPWSDPVTGDQLLEEIAAEFRRYLVLPQGAIEALSAWVLFTWTIDAFDLAPILAIGSPEKRCGKSTLLILLQEMVNRPLLVSNTSQAALFRCIESFRPTLLLDEADAWMRENQELRGIINAGHTRKTAKVMRTVGEEHTPKPFDTFCPKAIAGIGRLADTISDRALIVPMRRKLLHEEVERLRQDRLDLSILCGKCARWATDNIESLRAADPEVPNELNDRARDNWRPLIAIADTAGGGWPKTVRQAALQLIDPEQDEATHGMMLLEDLYELFLKGQRKIIPTYELISELNGLDERPWSEWSRGAGIKAHNLSKLLKPFGITSKQDRTADGGNLKGYRQSDCLDAFSRYLSVDKSTLQRYTPDNPGRLRPTASACARVVSLRSAATGGKDAA